MKGILTILIFSVYVLNSFASSPQLPDYLIFNKDTIPTYNLLVEEYLQKIKEDKGRLFNLSFRNTINGTLGSYENCWRGYQAIYEIHNDSLFVNAIISCYSLENKKGIPKNYINQLFGEKVKNGKVFVDWFSGKISFPLKTKNNKLLRWDGVFERIFLFEKVIKIKNGSILEIRDQKNYGDLKNGLNRIEKDSIRGFLFSAIKNYKWTKLDKFDCSESYSITIGKKGKVTNVVMPRYQTKESITKYWDRREYNHCINSLKKALSKLQFDILKRKGEPTEEKVYIEIWIDEDGTIENWTD